MSRQNIKIQWPEFGDSVRLACLAFSDDVEKAVTKEAEKAAKQCRKDIQNAAPKRSGAYAKSWSVTKDAAGRHRPAFIVHAKKPGYQLAHLLERPHRIVNGYGEWGKTTGQPHIEPAANRNGERFIRNVSKAVQNLS